MIGSWLTRSGQRAVVDRKGHSSSNVLVGEIAGVTKCWNAEGRYRWDGQDHDLDLVSPVREALKVPSSGTLIAYDRNGHVIEGLSGTYSNLQIEGAA